MTDKFGLHYQEWGKGPPVLALHGLGLDSSSFTGLANGVQKLGMRMLAVDLPGFGQTPAPDAPLTSPVLAAPVIELARSLKTPPIVMGMSLGARVALECALHAPELFRGVVMMAPPLPRCKHRWSLQFSKLFLIPGLAERIPVEKAWPWLKKKADQLEAEMLEDAEHDWMGRAAKRMIYYISCPATRRAFVSAARELALDPAYGPEGVWTRLPHLQVPAAFVWGDKDKVIPMENIAHVEHDLPGAFQIHVPCAGHFDNGPHFICMEMAAVEGVSLVDQAAARSDYKHNAQEEPRSFDCLVPAARAEAAG